MRQSDRAIARARCDGENQLLSADDPLAALQMRCGGEIPGTIAMPELLRLVQVARRYGMKLTRPIQMLDGDVVVRCWAEVIPDIKRPEHCAIALYHWHSAAQAAEDADQIEADQQAIDQTLAELTARLDARQQVMSCSTDAADLQALCRAMQAGIGQPWTEFVTLTGNAHHQPMHWRLLDGARVAVTGSNREWRVRLTAQNGLGTEPEGFDLLLVSDTPLPSLSKPAAVPDQPDRQALIGQEVAPVLRQPIARIIANAETIRTRMAGPLSKEYQTYAADIATAGQHLLALIDDLADLEVVEGAGFTTAPDAVDLAQVAMQAAGILAVRARDKQITIVAPQSAETLPAIAEFRRVLQVLLNLLGNAINYAPSGSQVWLRLDAEGVKARVIVADQGPGMSAEDAARVFNKFERLGRSGDGGSGLGLYISRRLARAMGGDLTVESAPGEGARFVLELPKQ